MRNRHGRSMAILLGSLCVALPASAQSAGQPESGPQATASQRQQNILQEVIVTAARKRTENVQTTPIAVTAVNEHLLEQAHVTSYQDIGKLAPNMQAIRTVDGASVASVYLRGFGSISNDPSVDPHVAVFLDGIYQPEPNGSLQDMFDVSDLEVLAGPQGTLFGKNAPIGAVTFTTTKPTGDFSGMLEGDYGSYDHFGLRGRVNIPLAQDATGNSILAGKVSFVEKEGGNWIYDTANGKHDFGGENDKAGRIALMFTPNSDFEWDLTSSLDLNRNPQAVPRPYSFFETGGLPGTSSSVTQPGVLICRLYGAAQCAPTPYGTTQAAFTSRDQFDLTEVASNMTYRLDPVTLTSVTGFIDFWELNNASVIGANNGALNSYGAHQDFDQESEEFRISSNRGGGWDLNGLLDWVVGGYYSNFHFSGTSVLGTLSPLGVPNTVKRQVGVTQSEAAFAHVIFNFTDQWTGTFGVRQSWDHKDHNYQPTNSQLFYYDTPAGFHNTSFEAGTAYQFDKNRMAYFRFAQGYEAGGFLGYPAAPHTGVEFQPETNNAYEVGFKSDWLNKRLRVNLDLFVNELSNLQVSGAFPLNVPPFFVQATVNAGSATVEGLEAQIVGVPIDDLTVHLNLGYLHTKYDQYHGTACSNVTGVSTDCSGNPFPFAPKWTLDLGADYAVSLPGDFGTLVLSADWNYKSSLYTSDPAYPASFEGGYGLVDTGIKYEDPSGRYTLEIYGTNILDRHYKVEYSDVTVASFVEDGNPAEWGLRATVKF